MDIEKLDINAVCFGILCNFTPVCGEERAKEAVELVRTLQAENEKLRAELEQVKHQRDSYRMYHDDLVSKPNCNTCADKDCKYRPIPGDTVRANCPLWRGSEEGEQDG